MSIFTHINTCKAVLLGLVINSDFDILSRLDGG